MSIMHLHERIWKRWKFSDPLDIIGISQQSFKVFPFLSITVVFPWDVSHGFQLPVHCIVLVVENRARCKASHEETSVLCVLVTKYQYLRSIFHFVISSMYNMSLYTVLYRLELRVLTNAPNKTTYQVQKW